MSDHGPDDQLPHEPTRQPPDEISQQQPDHLSDADVDADVVHIPRPRSPADDQSHIPVPPPPDQLPGEPPGRLSQQQDGVSPGNGLVEPEFWYEHTWKRGKRRRYHGFVERVGGAEGQRLREDLAAALRDLLDWAAQQGTANSPDARGAEPVDGADSGDSKESGEGGQSS